MKPIDYVLGEPWAMERSALDTVVAVIDRVNQEPSIVESQLGKPLDNTETVTITDGVAVVPVIGPIARYMNIFTRISGGTSIEILARDFRAAVENPKVKAVILNMDSPGGTVNGTSEFASQVFAARSSKPIVAYASNNACSGAYWIASACSEIVANDTAHLGSIGVVGGYVADKPDGRTTQFVSARAKNKRPDMSTEDGRAVVQAQVDAIEDVFISSVARYRGVSEEKVESDFGQGDHFIGSKAVEAGMADRLGSLDALISELSKGQWAAPQPKPEPKPARKADTPPTPRRPAMSGQIDPPESGAQDTATISASELAELRRQAAESTASRDEARLAVQEAIDARADAFVAEVAGAANKTLFAVNLRTAFVQAAQDDHAHPVAGSKAHRQDALREAMKARPAPTKEVASGDIAGMTRALAEDPAIDAKAKAKATEADEAFTKANKDFALAQNGQAR